MIETIKHKGLRRYFETGDAKGLSAEHVRRIGQILALLDAAENLVDLGYRTFKLHPLTGDLRGFWAFSVSANWRIIFRFEEGCAYDVDLVDYH